MSGPFSLPPSCSFALSEQLVDVTLMQAGLSHIIRVSQRDTSAWRPSSSSGPCLYGGICFLLVQRTDELNVSVDGNERSRDGFIHPVD